MASPASPIDRRVAVASALQLPSNAIRMRLGNDETEPREVTRWGNRFVERGLHRASIAINTYYPEIEGGYYKNLALIRLVQNALRAIGCHVVWNEVLSDSRPCPDELDGILHENEEYTVVRNGAVVGALFVWHFGTGGGSQFLRDAIVLELAASTELATACFGKVEQLCAEHGVSVARH
jgi:hypothetical protein